MNNIPEFVLKNKAIADAYIEELLGCDLSSDVVDAMRYSISIGGKRIRPCLVVEFCKACGGKAEDCLDFASAIEMIHTYSLIHDDLPCMDDDDTRRGMPSCHIKFGYANALLAGDGLLTKAFEVVSKCDSLSAESKVKASMVLSECAGVNGMIGGQVLDLDFEKSKPNADQILNMYKLKTGALLSASAKLGCIAAGADDDKIKSAEAFGYNLGIAFQIVDDILDVCGDEALLGKPIGSDAEQNKSTYVSLVGLESAKEQVVEYTNAAINSLSVFGDNKSNLVELAKYLIERNY